MAAITSNLFLYSLTIQPASSVTQAVVGAFGGGGAKDQYILTATGSSLNLLRPDANDGEVTNVLSHNVFGIIRSVAAFRLAGTGKDYAAVGTDSGRITTLEYLPEENRFQRIHLETFGKSGVRRAIPGQYLAMDPKGRACMIASVEKNKLVFVLNRDPQSNLTISSPLEAHTPSTVVYAVIALDVAYENPVFAALEVDYSESDSDPDGIAYDRIEKQVVYYELDLGLNHVVRKWAEPVDRSANLLFQVPGGADGPSGVLVCAEETITYRHVNQDAHRLIIPRRKGAAEDPDRKRHIVCGVMHKMKGAFFILVQTEDGDLFKVTMSIETDRNSDDFGRVLQLKLQYFATLPVATNLLVLKSGTLFVASECGEHRLYRFLNLGDDYPGFDSTQYTTEDSVPPPYEPEYFHAQEMDESLELLTTMNTTNPTLSSSMANVTEDDAPQIFSVCGTGARSSFKMMQHGLEVSELAESGLPAAPNAIWTTKLSHQDEFDSYIILAFNNYTLVLSVGENIEEVSSSETGFIPNVPTLAVQLLADNALVQIHHRGLRHIRPGGSSNDWEAPQHRTIVAAATNERQVALALSSGQVIYFEIDESGSLGEYEDQPEMAGTVKCLSLGSVPEGRQRSQFLAVGCDDLTVRILSTDPNNILATLAVQALTYSPSALHIMEMADPTSGGSTLYLHVGLQSGVYIRVVLDEVTGNLSDSTTRFLGPKAVKFAQANVQGYTALMALSSRSWLVYSDLQTNVLKVTPLSYERLDQAWRLSSTLLAEGIVAVSGQNLKIFSIPSIKSNLLTSSTSLAYTPRDLSKHPDHPLFSVIESDSNILPSATRIRMQSDPGVVNGDAAVLPPREFGYPHGAGHWASCIQVVDPVGSRVACTLDLEDNEAATSCVFAPIESQDNESFLFVGTGKDMMATTGSSTAGYIHVYRMNVEQTGDKMKADDDTTTSSPTVTLEFLHKTKVQEPPRALRPFRGRLLAGFGPHLAIFDVGMQQLLRKTIRLDVVPNTITSLQVQGSRILAGDARESITYVKYAASENLFLPFADDSLARWTTCQAQVDYETTAGADKFGNIFLLRCPPTASKESDSEGAAQLLRHERNYLAGAPNRLDMVAHFFTADVPMALHKTTLVAGGRDVLLWSGLQGTTGVLVPFVSRDDVEFFSQLERHMRETDSPLCGRDHLMYRSYYQPVKGVVDGDLCERFLELGMDQKMMVAAGVEKSVREVVRKVMDMRIRSAF